MIHGISLCFAIGKLCFVNGELCFPDGKLCFANGECHDRLLGAMVVCFGFLLK